MIREGMTILELLCDENVFPYLREQIKEYKILVAEKAIELETNSDIDNKILASEISYLWSIEKK